MFEKRCFLCYTQSMNNLICCFNRILFFISFALLFAICSLAPVFAEEIYTGEVSWYGPGFHARTTANGEAYDMYGLTAAHREWKFGTLVEVYNRSNKRKCIIRVNDRGPVSKSFLMDLSYGGAMAIGSAYMGKAFVRLTIVGDESGAYDKDKRFYLYLDDDIVLPQKFDAKNFIDIEKFSEEENYFKNIAGGIEIFQLMQKHIKRLYQADIENAPHLLVSIDKKICLGPYRTFNDAQADYHKIVTQYPHAAVWLEQAKKAIPLVVE